AGGHLALMTALTPKLAEPDEDQTIPSQPDALVLFNPVLDTGPEGFAQHRMPENWREIHRTQEGA
ncbi:MAG: alpha/beta hydrolase, partial [Candidatus Sumerlaeia bacterium]